MRGGEMFHHLSSLKDNFIFNIFCNNYRLKGDDYMLITGIIAVDQHWGATDPIRYRKELNFCLFDRINHMKKLDFIIFGGDTFDMKEYVSSSTFKEILEFIYDLINATKNLNTKIVFIEGTRTHDSLQLDTLDKIFRKIMGCDRISFISTVCEDKIKDMSVLYIPEEYMADQDSYYKEFFNKTYDMIVGHGITDKIWYAGRDNSIELNHHTTAPIFKVNELCNIANYVYFGHIHEHKSYGPNNRFISVGPSTRWEYGKEWDCGYYIVEYDTQSCLMDMEFVVNEKAPKLITKAFNILETETIEKIDSSLDNILSIRNDVDGLRIIVNLGTNVDKFESIRDFIITKIGQHKNVKLVLNLVDNEDESTNDNVSNESEVDRMELSGKILESAKTPVETQVANFILYKHGEHIPIDYIKEVLEIND